MDRLVRQAAAMRPIATITATACLSGPPTSQMLPHAYADWRSLFLTSHYNSWCMVTGGCSDWAQVFGLPGHAPLVREPGQTPVKGCSAAAGWPAPPQQRPNRTTQQHCASRQTQSLKYNIYSSVRPDRISTKTHTAEITAGTSASELWSCI